MLAAGFALAQPASVRIRPADLRAHVEFLASDELEGRRTPSHSLSVAAAYIASQFRRAGLDPLADGTYFQNGAEPETRNVIGILPGLRPGYVLVTAHYDHIGVNPTGEGDRINNGADDNASGVASVIEVARVLSTGPRARRRTVVFIAFYGEEQGLVGSQYYADHPVFPIGSTVAQINFEQTGRTDDLEGPNQNVLNVTGFAYSQVASILQRAVAPGGVKVLERKKWSEAAFERSDNLALAKAGVPAHTLSAAYMFPDYHKPGDEWAKLDYANMSRITAAAAAGIQALATRAEPPHWYAGAPVGADNATKWSTPVTRPAVPPAASDSVSGKSRATRPQPPRQPSRAR